MSTLGQNIRAAREAAGLTQKRLAEKVFVSRGTISHYENDTNVPSSDILLKIAAVLKTTRDELEGNSSTTLANTSHDKIGVDKIGVEAFPGIDAEGWLLLRKFWDAAIDWKNKGL